MLGTLGVERDDLAGLGADQVHDRVGQLFAALEDVDFAKEHCLGTHGQLAFTPSLIEERDPDVASAVAHLGSDE